MSMKAFKSRLKLRHFGSSGDGDSVEKSPKNHVVIRSVSSEPQTCNEESLYLSDVSGSSTPVGTPKKSRSILSGKVIFSISPSTSRKSSARNVSASSSPVFNYKMPGKMTDRRSLGNGTSFAKSSSFASCKSLERGMTAPGSSHSFGEFMTNSPGKSLNGSFTSLSIGSSPAQSMLSLTTTSEQFYLSLSEAQFKEERKDQFGEETTKETVSPKSKSPSDTGNGSKKRRTFFKIPFKRGGKSSGGKRRNSNADCYSVEGLPANFNNSNRSQSLCVGDSSDATNLLEKFREDNEALSIELRGKDEELQLLNATMDQANQTHENTVQALLRAVEAEKRKNEHLIKILNKEQATAQANASKPAVRVPVNGAVKRTSSQEAPDVASSVTVDKGSSQVNPRRGPLVSPTNARRGFVETRRKMAVNARPYGKTEDIKEKLFSALSSSKCLSQLPQEDLRNIVDSMKCKRINKGERLMQEGNAGQAFYVLADGDCKTYKQNQESVSPNLSEGGKLVAKWEVFGDSDVFYNTRRVCSCKCVRQGAVWYVTRDDYKSAVTQHAMHKRKQEISKCLQSVKIFKNLKDPQIRMLANAAKVEQFAEGDYILRQGLSPNNVYVIKEGNVTLTRQVDGTETRQQTLTVGEVFGDELASKRYENNAVATGKDVVQCVVIPLKNFDLIREHLTSHANDVTANKVEASLGKRVLKGDGQDSSSSGHTASGSSGYWSDNSSVDNRARPKRRYDVKHRTEFEQKARELKGKGRSEFNFIATIGNGAFGSVDLVSSSNNNSNVLAIKKLSKHEIVASEQQKNAFSEKTIQMMTSKDCPFIASMYSTFKDNRYVYFVMEFCPGGELFSLLTHAGSFDDVSARFYVGCVIEALAFLHAKHAVFRDLKPENVVIDKHGYCKLTDFGFAKKFTNTSLLRTYTYCGTPEYMAPEIILSNAQTFSVDLWSLGVFAYEILVGKAPFRNKNRSILADTILNGIQPKLEIARKDNKISLLASNLIEELCKMRPEDRLGAGRAGISDVTRHSWFNKFDWVSLRQRTLTPPWMPKLSSSHDVRYFDTHNKANHSSIGPTEEFSGWDEHF